MFFILSIAIVTKMKLNLLMLELAIQLVYMYVTYSASTMGYKVPVHMVVWRRPSDMEPSPTSKKLVISSQYRKSKERSVQGSSLVPRPLPLLRAGEGLVTFTIKTVAGSYMMLHNQSVVSTPVT